MAVKIRQVKIEDLDRVTKVEAICFPPAEAASKESFNERIQGFSDSFFVAEEDNIIIGFINGCVTEKPELPDELYHNITLHNPLGDYQTIFGLDVIPSYQRKGIAAELMKYMIESAKERGKKGIVLTCKDHLVHYYEGFGYKNMGVSKSCHGGSIWNDMLLMFS